MTPAQEQKMEAIFTKLIELDKKVEISLVHQDHHKTITTENYAEFIELKKVTEGIVTDRNKAIGAMWLGGILGGSGFLAGLGALVMGWFKH